MWESVQGANPESSRPCPADTKLGIQIAPSQLCGVPHHRAFEGGGAPGVAVGCSVLCGARETPQRRIQTNVPSTPDPGCVSWYHWPEQEPGMRGEEGPRGPVDFGLLHSVSRRRKMAGPLIHYTPAKPTSWRKR